MKLKLNTVVAIACILFLFVFTQKGFAQQKRMLTPADYKLWNPNAFIYGNLSADGKWIMYVNPKKEKYVQNSITGKKFEYPNINWGTFSPDSKWFAYTKGDSLFVHDLGSGSRNFLTRTSSYEFIKNGKYILTFSGEGKARILHLWNLRTLTGTSITNVKEFSLNEDQSILAIVTEEGGRYQVRTIKIDSEMPAKIVVFNDSTSYNGLVWNKAGTTLAFYDTQKVYVCNAVADAKSIVSTLNQKTIDNQYGLSLSDDGKQLFLYLKPGNQPNVAKAKEIVQIWRSDDKETPPVKQNGTIPAEQFVWWTGTDKLLKVQEPAHSFLALTGDQKYALLVDREPYLPQHNYGFPSADIYIKDLNTGAEKLIVKKLHDGRGKILTSPTGKYVAYFAAKQWWIYDIQKDEHRSITKDLDVPFINIDYDRAGEATAYDGVFFSDEDSKVMVTDQFDIWIMDTDGGNAKRITNGRENNITYRLYPFKSKGFTTASDSQYSANIWSPTKEVLITSLNNTNLDQGFYYWNKISGIKKLVQKAKKLEVMAPYTYRPEIGKKQPFLYLETDFNVPPRLMLVNDASKEQLVYQSNPQYKDFYWGKSELVKYATPDGKQLKGALFYPANYDPTKKYPMIVDVYEKNSGHLHNYFIPSDKTASDLNVANFTSDGYFILQPDIVYMPNDAGVSAAKCIIAATESIIKEGLVNKDRIGLIGYSFGGFETAFTLTQTNLFRTGISGGGTQDLLDSYLSVRFGTANTNWYENDQGRMRGPFYGEEFRRNSTIMNADKINAPLLLWAGAKDTNVEPRHSIKLQIALWRLNKKSTLLIYPEEGHGNYIEESQRDIAMRMKDWFDYYLKDEKPADWILNEETK